MCPNIFQSISSNEGNTWIYPNQTTYPATVSPNNTLLLKTAITNNDTAQSGSTLRLAGFSLLGTDWVSSAFGYPGLSLQTTFSSTSSTTPTTSQCAIPSSFIVKAADTAATNLRLRYRPTTGACSSSTAAMYLQGDETTNTYCFSDEVAFFGGGTKVSGVSSWYGTIYNSECATSSFCDFTGYFSADDPGFNVEDFFANNHYTRFSVECAQGYKQSGTGCTQCVNYDNAVDSYTGYNKSCCDSAGQVYYNGGCGGKTQVDFNNITVQDAAGNPLKDVNVAIYHGNNYVSATTDANGKITSIIPTSSGDDLFWQSSNCAGNICTLALGDQLKLQFTKQPGYAMKEEIITSSILSQFIVTMELEKRSFYLAGTVTTGTGVAIPNVLSAIKGCLITAPDTTCSPTIKIGAIEPTGKIKFDSTNATPLFPSAWLCKVSDTQATLTCDNVPYNANVHLVLQYELAGYENLPKIVNENITTLLQSINLDAVMTALPLCTPVDNSRDSLNPQKHKAGVLVDANGVATEKVIWKWSYDTTGCIAPSGFTVKTVNGNTETQITDGAFYSATNGTTVYNYFVQTTAVNDGALIKVYPLSGGGTLSGNNSLVLDFNKSNHQSNAERTCGDGSLTAIPLGSPSTYVLQEQCDDGNDRDDNNGCSAKCAFTTAKSPGCQGSLATGITDEFTKKCTAWSTSECTEWKTCYSGGISNWQTGGACSTWGTVLALDGSNNPYWQTDLANPDCRAAQCGDAKKEGTEACDLGTNDGVRTKYNGDGMNGCEDNCTLTSAQKDCNGFGLTPKEKYSYNINNKYIATCTTWKTDNSGCSLWNPDKSPYWQYGETSGDCKFTCANGTEYQTNKTCDCPSGETWDAATVSCTADFDPPSGRFIANPPTTGALPFVDNSLDLWKYGTDDAGNNLVQSISRVDPAELQAVEMKFRINLTETAAAGAPSESDIGKTLVRWKLTGIDAAGNKKMLYSTQTCLGGGGSSLCVEDFYNALVAGEDYAEIALVNPSGIDENNQSKTFAEFLTADGGLLYPRLEFSFAEAPVWGGVVIPDILYQVRFGLLNTVDNYDLSQIMVPDETMTITAEGFSGNTKRAITVKVYPDNIAPQFDYAVFSD